MGISQTVKVDKNVLDEILELNSDKLAKFKVMVKDGSKSELTRVELLLIHPVAESHRLMSTNEFHSLVASIAEVGQIEPVTLYRGKVIDGRHRLQTLKLLGIEYIKYKSLPNNTTIDELREIVRGTEMRRHDSSIQKVCRAIIAREKGEVDDLSDNEISTKFGTTSGSMSKMNTVLREFGIATLEEIYRDGYTMIGGNKVQSISKLYEAAQKKVKDRIKPESTENGLNLNSYTEENKRVFKWIDNLIVEQNTDSLALYNKYITNKLAEFYSE